MEPVIIFCAFTRPWALERWIADFEALDYPKNLMSLAFIVDDGDLMTRYKLVQMGKKYRKCTVVVNDDHPPNEVNINARRLRIVDVKNQSKELIAPLEGEFVIGLEDDTVFPPDTIQRLLEPFRLWRPYVGFVEGVQCGRWGARNIGAWEVDDVTEPSRTETLMPPSKEIYAAAGIPEPIDGGGFYGYATPKTLYLECEYSWSGEPWGPDVNYGLWLRREGYHCMIDWSLEFGHHTEVAGILWPDAVLSQIAYTKDNITNQWHRSDIENNR